MFTRHLTLDRIFAPGVKIVRIPSVDSFTSQACILCLLRCFVLADSVVAALHIRILSIAKNTVRQVTGM